MPTYETDGHVFHYEPPEHPLATWLQARHERYRALSDEESHATARTYYAGCQDTISAVLHWIEDYLRKHPTL